VGEPITRTVTLKALGVTAGQLPDLKFEGSESLKVYPETPKSETKLNGTELTSTKTFKVTYIPSHSGKSELPSLTVTWWDLKKNRQALATLKGQSLQVAGPVANKPSISSGTSKVSSSEINSTPVASLDKDVSRSNGWLWWLVLAFLGIWLLTLLAWRMSHRRAKQGEKPQSKAVRKTLSGQKRALKQACMSGNASQAQHLLCSIADRCQPEFAPHHLGKLKSQASKALAQELERLEAALYGREDSWDGAALWQAYLEEKSSNKQHNKKANPNPLEPLSLD